MPFCTNCGKQNPDDARFCAQCGTRLLTEDAPAEPAVESTATITFGAPEKAEADERDLNPADSAAVDALPSGHALLVVQRGPSAGARFLLDADLVSAGRRPDSEIFLDDVTVSDVGSLNGTYVNRDRIDEVELNDGDEVQIGKYRLVFFASHQAQN